MARTDLVQCQGCHGDGGYKEVILDDGSGPWEPCGYCKDGRTTKMMNAWIMRWSAQEKKNARMARWAGELRRLGEDTKDWQPEHWNPSDEDIELHATIMAPAPAAGEPGDC